MGGGTSTGIIEDVPEVSSVEETSKVCPNCGYKLPLGANTVVDERGNEICDNCARLND